MFSTVTYVYNMTAVFSFYCLFIITCKIIY